MDTNRLENKFFDKLLIVRAESNLQYMIDQLRECLESESVILNKDEILQLFDIFIRAIINDLRFNENKELYPINAMIGHIVINIESINSSGVKKYIEDINSTKNIFSDNTFKNIIDNIDIVCKEFSIFINELLNTLRQMFESIDVNKNVRYFTGVLRSKNNKRISIMYTIPPTGLNRMVFIIQSNIISDAITSEELAIIANTFNEDDNFKAYLEKISKN